MGAVVNIVTEEPEAFRGVRVTSNVGSEGTAHVLQLANTFRDLKVGTPFELGHEVLNGFQVQPALHDDLASCFSSRPARGFRRLGCLAGPARCAALLCRFFSGFLSAVAGIVMTARMQSGQPAIGMGGGLGLLLNSITGVILGGIDLSGGKGSLFGILGGTLFIGILTNGLAILGFGTYRQMIIIGLALMAALCWNVLRVKK